MVNVRLDALAVARGAGVAGFGAVAEAFATSGVVVAEGVAPVAVAAGGGDVVAGPAFGSDTGGRAAGAGDGAAAGGAVSTVEPDGFAVTPAMTPSGVPSRLARWLAGPTSYQPSHCGTANTSTKV